jgi:hypothetical protein
MALPSAIARYFEAANRFDHVEAGKCFAIDARVHDESRDYVGSAAIEHWIQETSRKYRPRFEIRHFDLNGEQVLATVEVSGTFPGSPIELEYQITLSEGLISELVVL